VSRTDPNKRKPCSAKRTALLVGEGETEYAFLCHLKRCFVERESGIFVKVEPAHGGSPETVIRTARKLLDQRAYDRCLILMDTDLPWPKARPHKVDRTRITYVAAKPCVEGLLLAILQHKGIVPASSMAAQCKKVFYDNYIAEKKRTDPKAYEKHFTRDVLNARRKMCVELDVILGHME